MQPLPNIKTELEALTRRGARALGMATAADDICCLSLTFAISAAIIAVLLGDAVATWMGALLLVFHAHPVALCLPNF